MTTTVGRDALDLALVEGATDREVLEAAAESFPEGINLAGSNLGPVWVHPAMILSLGQEDSFGLEFLGLGHTAAELVRLAVDPLYAQTLGAQGCDRLIAILCTQAAALANAKRPNQLHAVRWGGAAKVALGDLVEPGTVEIDPTGNVAKRMAELFRCQPEELAGKDVLVMRHPFILGYVVKLAFNDQLTRNLVLANRLDFRKANQGDADGDQAFLFPIRNERLAARLAEQLEAIVPNADVTDWAFAKPCHEDADNWGEVLSKSTEDKLGQSFAKTVNDWVRSHIKLGDYANRLTPFSYRISNIGACMAAAGIAGGQEMALIGAILEESFYIGLTGGPEALDQAMDVWFNKRMTQANQRILFEGLEAVLDESLIHNPAVRTGLARGASINQNRFDAYDPQDLLVHMAFHVGKGSLTTKMDKGHLTVIHALADAGRLGDNVVAQALAYAGAKLGPVLAAAQPVPEIPRTEAVSDDDYYTSDWIDE